MNEIKSSDTHNDSVPALHHQGDFAAFVHSNQALIATAIAEVFPGPTTKKIGWLQANDNDAPIDEPWEYVSGLILGDSTCESRHLCVLGWVLAADWALRLIPEIRVENKVRDVIRIIADGGWKSAFVQQSEWDLFQSYIVGFSVSERISDDLNGKGRRDPRNNVHLQPLPWIGELGAEIFDEVDPLMAIHDNTATDIRFHGRNPVIINGQLSINWPTNNHALGLLSRVNELVPEPRSASSQGQITIGSPPLSFRVQRMPCANGEVLTLLRCVSGRPPSLSSILGT